MDARVVNDERYREKIFEGLRSIPSYSLVMDLDDLFAEEGGIYANAKDDGRDSTPFVYSIGASTGLGS